MASSCSGRKCFHFVSRVGSVSTPRPPSSATSIPGASAKWNAATIAVVLTAAVAVVAMVVMVIVLRRRRIREQEMRGDVAGDIHGAAGKAGPGEEGVREGGKWSAGAVELVVMAGETKPTYLATPTIQCPPLILAKGEDQ